MGGGEKPHNMVSPTINQALYSRSFQGVGQGGVPGGTWRTSCAKEMWLRAEGQQGSERS